MTEYNDLTINSGQTLTGKAWTGTVGGIYAKFVSGTCTVTGTIQLTGKGFVGGNLGGQYANGGQGEGTAGAGNTNTRIYNGNGGGGGNDGVNNTGGGGGGNSGLGGYAGGSTATDTRGRSVGNAGITNVNFGGAGGGPSQGETNPQTQRGGNGGGICIIIAKAFTMSGAITTGGNQGTIYSTNGTYGGSGAGGCILIKSQTATLGTNLATSLGAAAQGSGNNPGGAGSNGYIHLDYKTSYTGTTNPTLDATQDATLDYPASSNFFAFFS